MTQEKINKVQKIWKKANQIIELSRLIEKDDSECIDGITIGDMALLMEYVVALGEQKDNLELTLEGVMLNVDKWLEGDELYKDPVNRAIIMREKTLKIADQRDDAWEEVERFQVELNELLRGK